MAMKYANQAVIQYPVAILLSSQCPDLAIWYGDPLRRTQAAVLRRAAQEELHTRLRKGAACFQLHVLRLVCGYWMGSGSCLEYEQLATLTREKTDRALLELVYGQLLISRKLGQASRHLARGFMLAADTLQPAEYFRLVRQHELLGQLRLTDSPATPRKLKALLTEAAVIERLQQAGYRRYESTHIDTVG